MMVFMMTWVVMVGLVIGSFLNVVIYRLPAKLSIVKPRSRCGSCGTTLTALDLIPVVSYLFLKGRCRHCGAKVSLRYPAIEILTALAFVMVYNQYGLSLSSIFYMGFAALLICLAMIDYDHGILPNVLNLSIAALGLTAWASGSISSVAVVWGFAIGAGFMLAIILAGAIFKVEAMGMGDLKLMAASGLLVGPIVMFLAYMFAFTLGGLMALLLVITKRKTLKEGMPFGPYLALGLFFSLIYHISWLRLLM